MLSTSKKEFQQRLSKKLQQHFKQVCRLDGNFERRNALLADISAFIQTEKAFMNKETLLQEEVLPTLIEYLAALRALTYAVPTADSMVLCYWLELYTSVSENFMGKLLNKESFTARGTEQDFYRIYQMLWIQAMEQERLIHLYNTTIRKLGFSIEELKMLGDENPEFKELLTNLARTQNWYMQELFVHAKSFLDSIGKIDPTIFEDDATTIQIFLQRVCAYNHFANTSILLYEQTAIEANMLNVANFALNRGKSLLMAYGYWLPNNEQEMQKIDNNEVKLLKKMLPIMPELDAETRSTIELLKAQFQSLERLLVQLVAEQAAYKSRKSHKDETKLPAPRMPANLPEALFISGTPLMDTHHIEMQLKSINDQMATAKTSETVEMLILEVGKLLQSIDQENSELFMPLKSSMQREVEETRDVLQSTLLLYKTAEQEDANRLAERLRTAVIDDEIPASDNGHQEISTNEISEEIAKPLPVTVENEEMSHFDRLVQCGFYEMQYAYHAPDYLYGVQHAVNAAIHYAAALSEGEHFTDKDLIVGSLQVAQANLYLAEVYFYRRAVGNLELRMEYLEQAILFCELALEKLKIVGLAVTEENEHFTKMSQLVISAEITRDAVTLDLDAIKQDFASRQAERAELIELGYLIVKKPEEPFTRDRRIVKSEQSKAYAYIKRVIEAKAPEIDELIKHVGAQIKEVNQLKRRR